MRCLGSEFTIYNAQLILSACIYGGIEHLLKSPWFCLSSVPSITGTLKKQVLQSTNTTHTFSHSVVWNLQSSNQSVFIIQPPQNLFYIQACTQSNRIDQARRWTVGNRCIDTGIRRADRKVARYKARENRVILNATEPLLLILRRLSRLITADKPLYRTCSRHRH